MPRPVPSQRVRVTTSSKTADASANPGGAATIWVIGQGGRPEPVSVVTGLSDASGTQVVLGSLGEGQAVIVGNASSTRTASLFGFRLGF